MVISTRVLGSFFILFSYKVLTFIFISRFVKCLIGIKGIEIYLARVRKGRDT